MNGSDETTGTGRLAARFCGFKPLALRTVSIDAGAAQPFRAVCVADTHLVRADATDNDSRKVELAARRYPEMGFGERYLTEAVMRARSERTLMLHLGDIYDFVSSANLKLAGLAFGADDWFACVGNHDFSRYVGEAREDAAYKAVSAKRVAEVWPNDISFASRVVNGVNLVAVDNVYYNFTEEQLALMEREVAKGLPIVMMCHVPLYTPGLYAAIMAKTGGVCSYQCGVPDELVDTWKAQEFQAGEEWRDRRVQQRADAPTLAFIDYIKAQPLLKAILCGHTHFFWEERFSPTATQIVCPGTYAGEALELRFARAPIELPLAPTAALWYDNRRHAKCITGHSREPAAAANRQQRLGRGQGRILVCRQNAADFRPSRPQDHGRAIHAPAPLWQNFRD